MKLKSIEIKNFRGIRDVSVDLDDSITVFIGRNGSGKTTILDAVAFGLGVFSTVWPTETGEVRAHPMKLDVFDVHDTALDSRIIIEADLDFSPITLEEKHLKFVLSSNLTEAKNNSLRIYQFFKDPVRSLPSRPLFIYYRQDRAFETKSTPRSRSTSNEDSLSGDLRAISDLEDWWDKRDADEARAVRDKRDHSYRDPQLEAIRNLIREVDTFSGVYYSSTKSLPGLYFEKKDGASVHVSKLSSGERSYIILLADLARRLQISAPESSLGEIPGVVLIDEIELNLHPAWQSQIIPKIKQVFRSCQFIISTHSPHVLSAVESKRVRSLRRGLDGVVYVEVPKNTKGRSSNYLLEGVLGAAERYPEVDDLIAQFNNAIDFKDAVFAKSILSRISKQIEGSPTELLVFKKRLKKLQDQK